MFTIIKSKFKKCRSLDLMKRSAVLQYAGYYWDSLTRKTQVERKRVVKEIACKDEDWSSYINIKLKKAKRCQNWHFNCFIIIYHVVWNTVAKLVDFVVIFWHLRKAKIKEEKKVYV